MEIIAIIEKYFLVFIIYAVAGWCVEEVFCSIIQKKIVDRGFLIGPVCPIYGFGGLAITLFLTKFNESPITVFCMGIILCAFLEYFTSYIMEKIFNARWWDYSDSKLNLNGRICINTLIPFGVFGLLVIYAFNPVIYKFIFWIGKGEINVLSIVLLVTLAIDCIISYTVVSGVTERAEILSKENPKDNTDEITAKVKEELKESYVGQRLLDAFPDFKTLTVRIKKIAKKSKIAVKKGKRVVKQTAGKGKKAIEKGKEKVIKKAKPKGHT